jgi:hypothetical protein
MKPGKQSEAGRLRRNKRDAKAMEEMRAAFVGVDPFGGKGEPTSKERAIVDDIIKSYRSGTRLKKSRGLLVVSTGGKKFNAVDALRIARENRS